MKKIALVSVHNDPNYGSVLQAFALAHAIKREGYDCEYLNYLLVKESHGIKALVKKMLSIVGFLKKKGEYSFWSSPDFRIQRQHFSEFHDRLIPFSVKRFNPENINEANNDYDCFVVGSDQTWSPYVTMPKNTINFLDFVDEGKVRGSYAPSLGTCHLQEDYIEKLKVKIGGFDYLSCREKQNAEFLTTCFGRTVEHVLDPTLLLSSEEWLKFAEPVDMPKNYVLCYILGTKDCIAEYAERLGVKESLPMFYIVSRPEYLNRTNALKDITPGQFITLISKATYVITDSFHGSLFSLNFRRQFYAFTKRTNVNGGQDNDRIGDFFRVLGISERLKNDGDFSVGEDIDYVKVESSLENMRESSKKYLTNLLKNSLK